MKKILSMLFVALMLLGSCIVVSAEGSAQGEVTVLFTHDLHSHFLPFKDETGEIHGGYARIMTAIKEQKEKYPDALLVDGGDFSMGSLFQTGFKTSALELRIMGRMGYDATTLGNHEFDYLPEGLAEMLNSAKASGEYTPQIVLSNYKPLPEEKELIKALESYPVTDYTLVEKGGTVFALFGIFGVDSDDCAPNSGMELLSIAETAEATVEKAVADAKEKFGKEPVVVCLSHSGTEDGEGEDYELAKAVDGIDLIVSGHTHTALNEPIKVNNTYIVSAEDYGRYLGVVRISKGEENKLLGYELVPVDDKVEDDKDIADFVEKCKNEINTRYLTGYGVSFDEVLVENPYKFETVGDVYDTQHESPLGNLYSDAYKKAVEDATGEVVDVAVTAAGVIRASIPTGKVTVSDVFDAASLGVGTEGELVKVYVTGSDLKNALEVDASVQPLMDNAQLFMSGVEYSFNTNRMIFNKVDYAMLRRADGSLEEIEDDKLYSVVTGMYVGQMLGTVEKTSYGLITVVPRDKDGNPLEADELVNFVVKDKEGNPLKEWYAISKYLQEMGGTMDEYYTKTDGRKVVYRSLSPADMLRGANKFTFIAIGAILLVILIIVAVVVITVRVIRKIKQKKSNK